MEPSAMSSEQCEFYAGLCRPDDPLWRKSYFRAGPTYALNYVRSRPPAPLPSLSRRSLCPGSEPTQPRVSIDFVRASFQKAPVRLMEDDTYLSVVLPEFRAEASVAVKSTVEPSATSAGGGDEWQLGWISALSRHDVCIDYEGAGEGGRRVRGNGSWEVPVLHMSTTDSTSLPWVNSDACTSAFTLAADADDGVSCSGRKFTVNMRCFEDRFLPQIPWKLTCKHSALYATAVTFDLEYYGWLMLRNVTADAYFVLKTLVWRRRLALDVCYLNLVGSRAALTSPPSDDLVPTRHNFPLPEWTISGPHAKGELTLLYHLAREHEAAVPYIIVEGKNYRYPQLPRM